LSETAANILRSARRYFKYDTCQAFRNRPAIAENLKQAVKALVSMLAWAMAAARLGGRHRHDARGQVFGTDNAQYGLLMQFAYFASEIEHAELAL
jgi:hypothetical protein